jgi:hypothetical protein
MKHRIMRRKGTVALFCAVAMVGFTMLTGVAFADGPTPATAGSSATLAPGTLNISTAMTAGTFAGTLNGAAQTLNSGAVTATDGTEFGGFAITDATGSGAGWCVTMQATPFENTTTDTSSPSYGTALPTNSFIMPALTVAAANDSSSAVPMPLATSTAIDTDSALEVADCCTAGEGMGTYSFTAAASAPWVLAVPADTYAGTYASTVTTTLATDAGIH